LVPGGGVVVDSAGGPVDWRQTPRNFFVHHGTLIDVYKEKLIDELQARGLFSLVPAVAWTKKFVVDIEAVEDGRSVVAYLAPYVHRVAISDHRIVEVTSSSVTYTYKPTQSPIMQQRTVTGQEFVAGFAQHVLPTGFHKVRHFGWMASNNKIGSEEIRMLVWMSLGWTYWLASGHVPQPEPIKRPKLRCVVCGGTMRVRRILHVPIPLLFLQYGLAYLDSS
jgi:hypothetical protein